MVGDFAGHAAGAYLAKDVSRRSLEVLTPIVQRKFGALPFGEPGMDAYQNFAITDDAVIFFFNQGQVLAQLDGPQQVSVPRAELASLLASA